MVEEGAEAGVMEAWGRSILGIGRERERDLGRCSRYEGKEKQKREGGNAICCFTSYDGGERREERGRDDGSGDSGGREGERDQTVLCC